MTAAIPLYVKAAYHDEPSFANAKVITSLFQTQLKGSLGPNFKKVLAYREVTDELLKPYKKNFDFLELGRLAIDYSDSIIEVGKKVNKTLISHAKSKNIPILEYSEESFVENYLNYISDEL